MFSFAWSANKNKLNNHITIPNIPKEKSLFIIATIMSNIPHKINNPK